MKIVVTVADGSGAVHVGSDVTCTSAIIEIKDEQVPDLLKQHLEHIAWAKSGKNRYCYETLSLSILEED